MAVHFIAQVEHQPLADARVPVVLQDPDQAGHNGHGHQAEDELVEQPQIAGRQRLVEDGAHQQGRRKPDEGRNADTGKDKRCSAAIGGKVPEHAPNQRLVDPRRRTVLLRAEGQVLQTERPPHPAQTPGKAAHPSHAESSPAAKPVQSNISRAPPHLHSVRHRRDCVSVAVVTSGCAIVLISV